MRLSSHTVVFDRDPAFARFLTDSSGSVLSILRIWVAEAAAGQAVIRHYLGSVRHCACGSWLSRRELYRLFRRARLTASFVGESAQTFRARLSSFLRVYFEEEQKIDT